MIAATNVQCDHDSRWTVYSQRDLASAIGVEASTITQWVRAGFPRAKAGKNRYRYCIPCGVAWHVRLLKIPATPSQVDDLMAAGGDSIALERYRLARAMLAEMDIEERSRSLVPRDRMRSGLGRFASIIRQLGERLGKRYGPEATLSVNNALDDCQRVVDDEFSDNND